jgi:hypothetical protein
VWERVTVLLPPGYASGKQGGRHQQLDAHLFVLLCGLGYRIHCQHCLSCCWRGAQAATGSLASAVWLCGQGVDLVCDLCGALSNAAGGLQLLPPNIAAAAAACAGTTDRVCQGSARSQAMLLLGEVYLSDFVAVLKQLHPA